jgi:hypothetical protein
MAYNINDYEPVEVRLDAWWKMYPNGRIFTEVLNQSETDITIRAFLFADRNDIHPMATGIANEVKGSSPVNRVSWVENCETSSIGRSLGNANFAAKGKRPSREEMEKVERYSHADHAPEPTVTPEQLNLAKEAMEQVPAIDSMAELKLFYNGAKEANLLSIKIDGKTINQAIGARKKELEDVK